MTQLMDKLDTQVAQNLEELLIATVENLDEDHNLTFVWGALKPATREMLMSITDDEEVKVALEAAIIQMAKSTARIRAIAKSLVTEETIMASVARLVANRARRKVSETAQQSIVIASQK